MSVETPILIRVLNPNTHVTIPRTDFREDVIPPIDWDTELTFEFARGALRQYAQEQIQRCPDEIIGGEERRVQYLDDLARSATGDHVSCLVSIEPVLMCSNLGEWQLHDLAALLQKVTSVHNRAGRAISIIQGILIGRQTAELAKR